MQKTQLLSDLVEIDTRIIATTALAGRAFAEREFERLIEEVRKLRRERAEIQAKLDAMRNDPPT